MTDHLKLKPEDAEILLKRLSKMAQDWDQDFPELAITAKAAYNHIRKLEAFRDEVMGLPELWRHYHKTAPDELVGRGTLIGCAEGLESIHAKHFGAERP